MTEVQICNIALGHLGMGPITSLSDSDPSSVACNLYFDLVRDDLLEEHRWAFATAVEALTDSTYVGTTLHPYWEYYYDYPDSCCNVWAVYNASTTDSKEEQDFEKFFDHTNSQVIIGTDLDDAIAEFTFKLENTEKWDTKFVYAFTYRLAGTMCHRLTGDAAKGLELIQLSNNIILEAKRIDAAEKIKKPKVTSSYEDSR